MLKAEGPKIKVLTHSPKFDIFSLSLSPSLPHHVSALECYLVVRREQNILAVSGGEPDYGWDV